MTAFQGHCWRGSFWLWEGIYSSQEAGISIDSSKSTGATALCFPLSNFVIHAQEKTAQKSVATGLVVSRRKI